MATIQLLNLSAPQGITIKKAEFNYQGDNPKQVSQINIELQHAKEFPLQNIIDVYYGQGYVKGMVPSAVQQVFKKYPLKTFMDSISNSLSIKFELENFYLQINIIHRFDEWFHSEQDVKAWEEQQTIGSKRRDLVQINYDEENTTTYMQILPEENRYGKAVLKLGDQKLTTSLLLKYTGVEKIHTTSSNPKKRKFPGTPLKV